VNDLRERKARVRAAARARRDAMPAEARARASDLIAERLLGTLERLPPRTVMVFASFGSEVSTRGIIDALIARGSRVALPVVTRTEMRAAPFRPGDPVRTAPYGAAEPLSADDVPADAIDVVVVPGLAFDRAGYRVGYGRGYYDRFLARTRPGALRIAVAFHVQLVDAVPHGDGDEPVDAIVTEREFIRCRPERLPSWMRSVP
jgi:5-formyltetrahydrofolate cyclo-ligase